MDLNGESLLKLYQDNYGLIKKLSVIYGRGSGVPIEDLQQECFFGVVEAAKRFDESRGVEFGTYLFSWLRAVIVRYIVDNGRAVRITPGRWQELLSFKRFTEDFEKKNGREPTPNDYAQGGFKVDDIELLRTLAAPVMSLDEQIAGVDDERLTLGDTIEDKTATPDNDAVNAVFDETLRRDLWQYIRRTCTERQYQVAELYFCNGFSYKLIGEKLNLSAEYARQILKSICQKLKNGKHRRTLENMVYGSEMFFGNVGNFQRTFTSATERTAIRHIEFMEDLKRII